MAIKVLLSQWLLLMSFSPTQIILSSLLFSHAAGRQAGSGKPKKNVSR